MNRVLLLAALACAATQAGAQTESQLSPARPFAHLKANTRMILNQQQKSTTAAKPATGAERLLAVSAYSDESTTRYDSIRYTYSGTRTSLLDNHNMSTYLDDYDPLEQYLPGPLTAGNVNVLQYDSAIRYTLGSPDMVQYNLSTKVYDAENRAVEYNTKDLATGYAERYLMSYSAGRTMPDTVRHFISYSESFEMAGVMYSRYDGSNRKVADTFEYIFMTDLDVRQYSYTPAGLLMRSVAYMHHADGTTDSISRSNYTYDGAGRLVAALELTSDGNGELINDQLDSFAYTGSSAFPTKSTRYAYESGSWQADYQTKGTLNGFDAYSELVISIGIWGTLFPSVKSVFQYNANQHIARQQDYMWAGTGFQSQPEETFYYHYAGGPTSVAGTAGSVLQQSIYPNPATDCIFISGAGRMSISVYNLSGQLLLQQSGMAQNGRVQLNIGSLPAGAYLADVQTENGRSKVKFVKQ